MLLGCSKNRHRLVLISIVRHTDMEMIVMKEFIHSSEGHVGKHHSRSGGNGRKKMAQRLYWGFHRKEWVRQGRRPSAPRIGQSE